VGEYLRLGNVLITGPTGRGKTEFMARYLDEYLKGNMGFVVIYDPKLIDYIDYQNRPNCKVIYDALEFYNSLLSLTKTANIDELVLILIDELSCLESALSKKKVLALLDELASNYQKYNLRFVISSQLSSSFSPRLKQSSNAYLKLNSIYEEKRLALKEDKKWFM